MPRRQIDLPLAGITTVQCKLGGPRSSAVESYSARTRRVSSIREGSEDMSAYSQNANRESFRNTSALVDPEIPATFATQKALQSRRYYEELPGYRLGLEL
jgi:hypothetical protein